MYDQRKKETLDIIRGLVTGEYVLTGTSRTLEGFGNCEMTAHLGVRTLLGSRTCQYSVFDPSIKKVIFHDPATIVFWEDGTKTVVKCGENDIFDPEKGLTMAIAKKALGNEGNYYNVIKKWLPKEEPKVPESKWYQHQSEPFAVSTVKAAKKLGVSASTVRRWYAQGKLKGVTIQGSIYIYLDDPAFSKDK